MNLLKKVNTAYLLLLVFLVNFLQALWTPIAHDEAYYFMYAQNPDWGYFDHPPMIGWLIGVGDLIFDGKLAVRIFPVLFSILILLLFRKILLRKQIEVNFILLILIVLSIPIFHIYGFIATPDVPLLFFGTLYLLILDRFKQEASWKNTFLLGLSMALVMYSKYHGGLLILFSLLLSPRLWKKSRLYMALLFALLLYVPHIYWQWQHDFISLRFHLIERDFVPLSLIEKLKMSFSGMLLIINPVLLYLFLKSLFRYSIKEKVPGFYAKLFLLIVLFFIFYAFKAWVQAHWIAIAGIPFVIYLYFYFSSEEGRINGYLKWLIISIGIILLLRILLVLPLDLNTEFHREKAMYFDTIKNLANQRKIIFINSYQRAAKHTFYTGDSAFSLNNIYYRKNQYDLWDYDNFHNKDVIFIGIWPSDFYQVKRVGKDTILYAYSDHFQVFNRLKIKILNKDKLLQSDTISMEINNPHKHSLILNDKDHLTLYLTTKNAKKFIHIPLHPVEDSVIEAQSKQIMKFMPASALTPGISPEKYFVSGYSKFYHIKVGE